MSEAPSATTKVEDVNGSYAYPWSDLTEQQQTTRLDCMLDRPGEYVYNAQRDAYRSLDAQMGSPDFCPASAVEERRKARDTKDDSLDFAAPLCRSCGLEYLPDGCWLTVCAIDG